MSTASPSFFKFSTHHEQSLSSPQPSGSYADPSQNRPSSAASLDQPRPSSLNRPTPSRSANPSDLRYPHSLAPEVEIARYEGEDDVEDAQKSMLEASSRGFSAAWPGPGRNESFPSSDRPHPSSHHPHHRPPPTGSMEAYSFPPSSSSYDPVPAFLPPSSFSPSDSIWTSVNPFDESSSSDKSGKDGATEDGSNGRKSSFFLPTAIDGEPVRTVQACQSCRARKAKCDGLKDNCSRCIKHGLTCCYGPPRRIRGPNKSRSIPSLPKSTSNLSSNTPVSLASMATTSGFTAPPSSTSTPLFTTKALASKQPFRRGSAVDLGALGLADRKTGPEGSKVGGTRGKMDKTLSRGENPGPSSSSTAAGGRSRAPALSLSPSSAAVGSLPLISPGSQLPQHLSVHITPFSHPSYFPPPPEPDRRLSLQQSFPSSGSSAHAKYPHQAPQTQLPVHHLQSTHASTNLLPPYYAEPNLRSNPHFSERRRSSTASHRSHPYQPYPSQQQQPTPSPTIYTPSSPLNQPPAYPYSYFPTPEYGYSNPISTQSQYPSFQCPSHFQQHRGLARASVTSSTYSFAPTMHSSATTTSTSSPLPSPGGFSNWDGGWTTVGGEEDGSRRESYQSFDMVPPELVSPSYGSKGGEADGLQSRGSGHGRDGDDETPTPSFEGLDIRGWGDES